MKVQFNPRNDLLILVSLGAHPAVIVPVPPLEVDGESLSHLILPLDDFEADPNVTATYDRRGELVYTGNFKGRIVVIKVDGEKTSLVTSFRVSNTAVKQIEFANKRKDVFLVNSADRVIRVYECREVLTCGLNGEPEAVQKLQDLVNKSVLKKCCFSGCPDADYICAGSARQHSILIWERTQNSTLVKILQGTKGEVLLDVIWHPLRPIVASLLSDEEEDDVKDELLYLPVTLEIDEPEASDTIATSQPNSASVSAATTPTKIGSTRSRHEE